MTLEKVLVVLVLAAVIIGPHRLPGCAQRLAAVIRGVRSYTDAARAHVEREVGTSLAVDEWRSLDPRQYDPRRIVREALASPATGVDHPPIPSIGLDARAEGSGIDAPTRAASTAPRPGGGGIADLLARGVAASAPVPTVDAAPIDEATPAPAEDLAPTRHVGAQEASPRAAAA